LTGPTDSAEERKSAPVVGETVIVGELLAGLLVLEIYVLEPPPFNHGLALATC
jgi:hypothetical protein